MKYWIIAAGSDGFLWDEFRSEDNIRLGFDDFDAGDLSKYATKQQLVKKAKEIHRRAKAAGMLWNFGAEMSVGDYVFVRRAFQSLLGVGIVSSPYRHEPDRQIYLHVRDVHWIRTEVQPKPESINFAQDAIVQLKLDDPRFAILHNMFQLDDLEPTIGDSVFPNDVADPELYPEGSLSRVSVNKYERDPMARTDCIRHHGLACSVCEFDFQKMYGKIGNGHIHVHHITPLSEVGEGYVVNPIEDLRPVCPNCHAMLHKPSPPYTIAELQEIIKSRN